MERAQGGSTHLVLDERVLARDGSLRDGIPTKGQSGCSFAGCARARFRGTNRREPIRSSRASLTPKRTEHDVRAPPWPSRRGRPTQLALGWHWSRTNGARRLMGLGTSDRGIGAAGNEDRSGGVGSGQLVRAEGRGRGSHVQVPRARRRLKDAMPRSEKSSRWRATNSPGACAPRHRPRVKSDQRRRRPPSPCFFFSGRPSQTQ